MDLDRMLHKCQTQQWSVEDLDWTLPPPALSRSSEMTVVQMFTDMGAIERLAGALFAEQARRATDPRLQAIFHTFVVDEERHAVVAERLAKHYDVHNYQTYRVNAGLQAFAPHFLDAIRYVSDDVANGYITGGELILDVALLRSIDDFVADPMSAAAIGRINRDESRHIAIDYHMVAHYASDEYLAELARRPKPTAREQARAVRAMAMVMYHAAPFFRGVFFESMAKVDPSGRRLKEAFKCMQLLAAKPGVRRRPFARYLIFLMDVFNHPLGGRILGSVTARLVGVDRSLMRWMHSAEVMARASVTSFEELAEQALHAKTVR